MWNPFLWLTGPLIMAWIIREWWHAQRFSQARDQLIQQTMTMQHMSQDTEQLRQWNAHLQATCSAQTTASWQQHKDMEERWQNITAQALRLAQKDLMTHIEPVLSQWQKMTALTLSEHQHHLTHTVSPLDQTLQNVTQCMADLEKARLDAYGSLKEHLSHLHDGHQRLLKETNALSTAFRHPHIRGCWGEMQLRRVVELAGMLPYCDFEEQPTVATDKKQGIRPDMMIRLPGTKTIVVDAKAPLAHYLDATSASTTDEYRLRIKEHAQRVSRHIKALSDKSYWSHIPHAIEFTVLFLPGESFLSAALEADSELIELASQRNIVLATPMTLIALLKTIAQGWKHEALSQQTQTMITLTHEILKHAQTWHKQMTLLGKNLKQAQLAYHATSDVWQEHIEPRLERLQHLAPQNQVATSQQPSPNAIPPDTLHHHPVVTDPTILTPLLPQLMDSNLHESPEPTVAFQNPCDVTSDISADAISDISPDITSFETHDIPAA